MPKYPYPGKKIDRYQINVEGRLVWMEIRMDAKQRPAMFFVVNDEHGICERSESVDAAKSQADAIVRERLAIRWEPFLLVTFEGPRPHEMGDAHESTMFGAEMKIDVRRISVGTRPDGRNCWRYLAPQFDTIRNGLPKTHDVPEEPEGDDPAIYAPWLGTDKKTVAMVRDTPENVAELAAIVRGLAALNNRMHRVFSPSSLPRALAERRLRWLDPAGVPKISQDSTGGGE